MWIIITLCLMAIAYFIGRRQAGNSGEPNTAKIPKDVREGFDLYELRNPGHRVIREKWHIATKPGEISGSSNRYLTFQAQVEETGQIIPVCLSAYSP